MSYIFVYILAYIMTTVITFSGVPLSKFRKITWILGGEFRSRGWVSEYMYKSLESCIQDKNPRRKFLLYHLWCPPRFWEIALVRGSRPSSLGTEPFKHTFTFDQNTDLIHVTLNFHNSSWPHGPLSFYPILLIR